MNTNDVQAIDYYSLENHWQYMFLKQKTILEMFMEVEGYKEFSKYTFDINTLEDQELFKQFTNRVIEEIAEATMDVKHADHYVEEIVDALNFLLEVFIIYGWNETNLPKWEAHKTMQNALPAIDLKHHRDLAANAYLVVEQLCATNNVLKNRKWKQTQYLVDLMVFEKRLIDCWLKFNQFVNWSGITEKLLFETWSQKMLINEFRNSTSY